MEQRIVFLILFVFGLSLFIGTNHKRIYTWSDAEGYYLYLPALTLYGFRDIPVRTEGQFHRSEKTGRYYDKYTAGVAIMEAPFFGIAMILSGVDKLYTIDGYSRPFQRMILFGSIFYAMTGIGLLYYILRKHYTVFISIVAVISVFLGTNMYYYTVREPGMAHIYSFFLWVVLIWLTENIYKNPKWQKFLWLSVVISLLVFIRPTNIIAALVILGWNMQDWKERWNFIKLHFSKYVLLPIPLIILSVWQLLLWKHMYGSFVVFSYNEEPGFIYLTSPKILNVLFHVHNGLFIYAPILVLSVLGLIFGIGKRVANFRLMAIILVLFTYIFGSWWSWWFGGAYGHRCYVDLMPFFAISIAYFFDIVSRSSFNSLKGILGALTIFLLFYSIRMTEIYSSPWDGPGFMWPQFWEKVNMALWF